jgi:hypothetical protein
MKKFLSIFSIQSKKEIQMKKKVVLIPLFFITAFLVPNTAKAQFTADHNYIGPSIGLSFLGSSPEFGLNYEYGVDLQNVGTVGIGGLFRYWSYSNSYFYGKWTYTNILIGAQGNYHFKIPESKFDPYVGLILAYDVGSTSATYNDGYLNYGGSASAGGFWIALQAGARYWISPTLALTARLEFGSLSYGGLDVGVDFKL